MGFRLNKYEYRDYNDLLKWIPYLPKGFYHFSTLFPYKVTSARIGRYLRNEVIAGKIPNMVMAGQLACEGYIII